MHADTDNDPVLEEKFIEQDQILSFLIKTFKTYQLPEKLMEDGSEHQ